MERSWVRSFSSLTRTFNFFFVCFLPLIFCPAIFWFLSRNGYLSFSELIASDWVEILSKTPILMTIFYEPALSRTSIHSVSLLYVAMVDCRAFLKNIAFVHTPWIGCHSITGRHAHSNANVYKSLGSLYFIWEVGHSTQLQACVTVGGVTDT